MTTAYGPCGFKPIIRNTTDLLERLRSLGRLARAQHDGVLAREIERLVGDVLGLPHGGDRSLAPPVTEFINGRRVLVQRPRASFSV